MVFAGVGASNNSEGGARVGELFIVREAGSRILRVGVVGATDATDVGGAGGGVDRDCFLRTFSRSPSVVLSPPFRAPFKARSVAAS